MSKFECHCCCINDECARFHNPPRPSCNCIRQISQSTKFIEQILDCSETIVRVLSICGIHECKAKAAAEVIIFAFLHFDIVPDAVRDVYRKKLRKEDLFYDLGRKCRMNRVEAHLVYSIIKKAFKAFYYKQSADSYNPDLIDEFQWINAAKRTAEVYAQSEGLTETAKRKLENRIKCAYCSYIQRAQDDRKKEMEKNCNCSFCRKCKRFDGEHYRVFSNTLPKDDAKVFEFKKRLIEEGKRAACAPPDPCGRQILEWQTKLKASAAKGDKSPCKCGEAVSICEQHPECTCGRDPCICKLIEVDELFENGEGISVEWEPIEKSLFDEPRNVDACVEY